MGTSRQGMTWVSGSKEHQGFAARTPLSISRYAPTEALPPEQILGLPPKRDLPLNQCSLSLHLPALGSGVHREHSEVCLGEVSWQDPAFCLASWGLIPQGRPRDSQ